MTNVTTQWSAVPSVIFLSMAVTMMAQANIDGKWDISADSPHGKLSMELELKRSGEAVAGTLLDFQGKKRDMKGTFKDGTFTIQSADGEFALIGKPKADGTMTGQLSTPMGDVNWTAVRPKGTK